jgi:polysaccharide biosynthesis protein PslH
VSGRPRSVLVIAPGLPYPPDRGGKADIWRRAVALSKCGATVLLACPRADEKTNQLAADAATKAGIELFLFDRASPGQALGRWLMAAAALPLFSARRLPSDATRSRLLERARALSVNVVVSEGPWLWPLAKSAARDLRCPLVYRSHNIEFAYMRRQRELEQSASARMGMSISFLGLERFERRAIAESDLLLDISADDLRSWQHPRGRCLPPIPGSPVEATAVQQTQGVLFLGNLMSPNNLAGLKLLLDDVLPQVRRQVPDLQCHVVGSGPDAQTERWIAAAGASLHKDVPDPMAWAAGAGCIVNPVRDGSGVQLKTLDMLQTDRPIISFDQGLRGLPAQVRSTVQVVKTPEELVAAILELHRQGFPPATGRQQVRELFDDRAFFNLLGEVLQ